jgi:uncharacterized protein (UPF0212 family)
MNDRVVVEAAVPVYDVSEPDEAIRIAISKVGKLLNPDLNYVEIDTGDRTSPAGEDLDPAFVAAGEALVALELEMTVFNVESEEHASRIARKEIGSRLENIPLKVPSVEEIEDETDTDTESAEPGDDVSTTPESGDQTPVDDEAAANVSGDEDVLPEFEDLL